MVTIRPASPSDANEMLAIYRYYVTDTTVSSEYEPPSLEMFQERVRTYTEKLPWLICRIDGKAVGYGYASPHRSRAGYQWSVETSIYVAPEFQRHGIAGALYSFPCFLSLYGRDIIIFLWALPLQMRKVLNFILQWDL